MEKCLLMIFGISLLMISTHAYSRVVYYGSEAETITIAYGGPTILRFNKEIKTISQASQFKIAPADEVDPNYSLLSVTPRFTRGENKVVFILSDGTIVNTRMVIVSSTLPEKVDAFYDFKPKDSLIQELDQDDRSENISALELMKAMIKNEEVVGYTLKRLNLSVRTANAEITSRLVTLYTGSKYNGYVFEITNLSKNKHYQIDLSDLSVGNPNLAILSQVDSAILENSHHTRNKTTLRIVAKPTSVYYSTHLPVAALSQK